MEIWYNTNKCKFKLKDCFLCNLLNKKDCILCNEKDSVYKIINLDHNVFKKMYNIFMPKSNFSLKFIRDYMKKNNYIIVSQEYLSNSGLYGYISIRNKDDRKKYIMIEFTSDKGIISINISDISDNYVTYITYEAIEMMILHLLSSEIYDNEILIRISEKHEKLYNNLLKDMGFIICKEVFHVVPFLQINSDISHKILRTTRELINVYINKV